MLGPLLCSARRVFPLQLQATLLVSLTVVGAVRPAPHTARVHLDSRGDAYSCSGPQREG